MQTVSSLLTTLGRPRITKDLGHGPQVLHRAASDNIMPAAWYPGIARLCADDGLPPPPMCMFRFKRVPKADSAA